MIDGQVQLPSPSSPLAEPEAVHDPDFVLGRQTLNEKSVKKFFRFFRNHRNPPTARATLKKFAMQDEK